MISSGHIVDAIALSSTLKQYRTASQSDTHASIGFEINRWLRAKPLNIKEAAQFFEMFEHLGNCGLGVWHYGLSDESGLIGVTSFGTTCFSNCRGRLSGLAEQFGMPIYQIARGGTSDASPFNAPSRVLSSCLKQFQLDHGECILVAYADRAFNEMGTIYQACNAVYTGKTDPKGQSNYIVQGKWMSGWSVRKRFGSRSMQMLRKIDENVIRIPLTSKYRYLFVLAAPTRKKQILKALGPISQTYPKRETECIASMSVKELISNRAIRIK
jgi:hypothetical protein